MIQSEPFDIVGSYNNQRSSTIDAERSVNCFEYRDPLGKSPKSLIGTSGLINTDYIFGSETGGARGEFVFKDNHYIVFGESVFRISSLGVLTEIGSIGTASGYVGIDANTFQIIFVDGQNGYIWDTIAATFQTITDTGFPGKPIDVCYLDGFFVVANGDTNSFQLSEFNQGMVWSAGTATFTGDGTTDILTLSSNNFNFATGIPVTLSTTGTLPDPLNNTDTYYVIRVGIASTSPGTIKLATTYANAINNISIDITTDGTPVNTITVSGELQLGNITSHPGTIVGCRTLHRRLFLFSQNFTEVWENAGIGTNLPFRRNNSLLMEYGTPAIGSIAVGFDKMFFLSQDRDGLGSVMEVVGTQSVPASTRALDYQLAQYAELQQVSDCRGFLIKENGLIFYRINFTEANHTFIYNVSQSKPSYDPESDVNKFWHEEEVLNGDRHPAQTHAYFNGKNYVGDYNQPILYIVDNDTYTNNGESIRRMRITRAFSTPGDQRRRVDRIQINLLQGQKSQMNNIGPLNAYPYMFLSISKDSGQSYGNLIKYPMGKIGERNFRTVWRKLGVTPRCQAFVCKFELFDHIPFVCLGGTWVYEILPE